MINENMINYQLSVHILESLMNLSLITEEEFAAIDLDNQKILSNAGILGFNLISSPQDYIMTRRKEYIGKGNSMGTNATAKKKVSFIPAKPVQAINGLP